MTTLTRRRFVGSGLLAGLGLAMGGCVSTSGTPLPPEAQASLRLRAIKVDVSALRGAGLGPWADIVSSTMQPELARSFAARMAPDARDADTLVAKVTSVSLASWVGGGFSSDFGPSGMDTDYMEGEALILARDGSMRAHYPILLALPSSSAGAWFTPNIDQRRVAGLSRVFATWVRDYVLGRR